MPILDRLALDRLPRGAAVLDLCCGTGRISAALVERGFRVMGVEGSAEMVRYARENAPAAEFLVEDARVFQLDSSFDGAICVFESLNHVTEIEGLRAVFANVHRSLLPGGTFIFDLNREAAFEKHWNLHYVIAEDDNVCASRTTYDAEAKLGRCEIAMFHLNEVWERTDAVITQRCHSIEAARIALEASGFEDIQLFDAREDLGMTGDIALARTFFQAARPAYQARAER